MYKIKVNIRYIGTYIACRKDPAAPIYTERTLLAVLKPTGSLQYSDPSNRLQQATSHCLRVLAFTAALILDLIDPLHVTSFDANNFLSAMLEDKLTVTIALYTAHRHTKEVLRMSMHCAS